MSVHEAMMAPEPLKRQKVLEAPALPEKSARRPSRELDGLVDLTLDDELTSVEHLARAAAPHDTYLSSEEDASSSADDFSDFDYDSGSEGAPSPGARRRRSHEDTARMVSVVFVGRPSVVEVSPLGRRSASIASLDEARRSARQGSRSATVSSAASSSSSSTTTTSGGSRPPSSAASTTTTTRTSLQAAARQQQPQLLPRSSTAVFPSMGGARSRRPLFLNIDPFANGSTYSLDRAAEACGEEAERLKTPRSPTTVLRSGVHRTLRLVRKRSVPMLNTAGLPPASSTRDLQQLASLTALPPSRLDLDLGQVAEAEHEEGAAAAAGRGGATQQQQQQQPPVTFNDIMRTARKNARQSLRPQTPPVPAPPPRAESPVAASPSSTRRSLLGGLAGRRRSLKSQSRMQ